MNKLWIRAKICEILTEKGEIHYSPLISFLTNDPTCPLDPNCPKNVIEVLAEMYYEKHIWSSNGIVRWDHHAVTLEYHKDRDIAWQCEMIAEYVGFKWDLRDRLVLP